jgi:hypothetical protein
LGTANNLDPVDIVSRDISKIECALQALIDWDAIEQNLRVFTAEPANKNGGQLASRAGLDDR